MIYYLAQGKSPLLVSMPHVGTLIPNPFRMEFVPRALDVEDTDWHLDRLYHFVKQLGASELRGVHSRYIIDLNRPPDDAPMYPGASITELWPTRFFTGDLLHVPGAAPTAEQRVMLRKTYWEPYHEALRAELDRIKAQHGYALLWDAHSIRSEIPWLFEGVLPGLNIGTANGESADPRITQAVADAAARHPAISHVVNGRFKGGYTTRHYGKPADHVHAVQLEMSQYLYMSEEPPYEYNWSKAQAIKPVLMEMMTAALDACRAIYGK